MLHGSAPNNAKRLYMLKMNERHKVNGTEYKSMIQINPTHAKLTRYSLHRPVNTALLLKNKDRSVEKARSVLTQLETVKRSSGTGEHSMLHRRST